MQGVKASCVKNFGKVCSWVVSSTAGLWFCVYKGL